MAATLTDQLQGVVDGFTKNAPDFAKTPISNAIAEIKQSFDPKNAIQVGSKLPSFKLPNAVGKEISSSDLLSKGPLLITFYRGEWCPFCNLALRAFQKRLDDIHAKGASFVAISPELPDSSLTTVDKNELKFPVLSDAGNKFARQLGIVWKQPDELRPVFEKFGNDMKARNGDDSFEVPVPTTLLVDRDGVVRNVFSEADYTKRLEPQTAVEWIDAL